MKAHWLLIGIAVIVLGLTGAIFVRWGRPRSVQQTAPTASTTPSVLDQKLDALARKADGETSLPKLDALGADILVLAHDDEAGTVQYAIDYAKVHDDASATFLLSVVKALPLRAYGRDFLAAYGDMKPDQRSQVRDILRAMAVVAPGEDMSKIDTRLLTDIQNFFRNLAVSASGDEQKEALIYYTQIVPSDQAREVLDQVFLNSSNISEKTYQGLAIEIAVSSPDMQASYLPSVLAMFGKDAGIDHNFVIEQLSSAVPALSPAAKREVSQFLGSFAPVPAADPTFYHWAEMRVNGGSPALLAGILAANENPLDAASFAAFCTPEELQTYRSVLTTKLGEAASHTVPEGFLSLALGRLKAGP